MDAHDQTRPTLADIRAAADAHQGRGDPHADDDEPHAVARSIGAEVWLKFENLQFTAAYKERGALNKLLQLTDDERRRGVVAASAGNHAQAVAYHGRRLGIPVTIVMPVSTPMIKVTQTEGHGATCRAARRAVRRCPCPCQASSRPSAGCVFVHPFDDPAVIAGAGTVALEMLDAAPDLDMLVVPIGGGGLISRRSPPPPRRSSPASRSSGSRPSFIRR